MTDHSRQQTGILGGGLAGLTVAARLEGSSEVLEAGERPGGHLRSVCEEGFTYDPGGPHIIFSRNTETLGFMLSLLGPNIYRGRRANKIFFKGRYVKYPFENGLYDLDPQDRFECLYHYIENRHPSPANLKEWIYHTFGTGIAEKYLLPYSEKIWKVPVDQMSLDWVEGRIPRPPLEDVIKAAVGVSTEGYVHQLDFYYPATGGIESLALGMAREVRRIIPEFAVRHVCRIRDGWSVSDGRSERTYDRLVSTLPIVEMTEIFEDVPREVKEAAAELRYNSLLTVTIGLACRRLPDYTAIYVPDPKLIFHRLSLPGHFSPGNVPAGRSLIQAEITANAGDGVWELDDAELLRRVVSGLESMELVNSGDICYTRVFRAKYGYVVQDFNYRRHLEKVKSYFQSLGIALCGRNAEFEYINMDQCLERGFRVAADLNRQGKGTLQMTKGGCMPSITIAMITLNEERAVEKVIRDIQASAAAPDCEILVVDSSEDHTPELAAALGARVVRQFPPQGYGRAMIRALKEAAGEVVVTLDCDDTYPVDRIREIADMVLSGSTDLVNASRLASRPAAMPFPNYLANRLFAAVSGLLLGVKTTDVHSGMRAYRRTILDTVEFDPTGPALPVELLLKPALLGYRISEVFIPYTERIGATTLNRWTSTVWTFRRILRLIPLRFSRLAPGRRPGGPRPSGVAPE